MAKKSKYVELKGKGVIAGSAKRSFVLKAKQPYRAKGKKLTPKARKQLQQALK